MIFAFTTQVKPAHQAIYADEILKLTHSMAALLELLSRPGDPPISSNTVSWAAEEIRRLLIRRGALDQLFLGIQFDPLWEDPELAKKETRRALLLFKSGSGI